MHEKSLQLHFCPRRLFLQFFACESKSVCRYCGPHMATVASEVLPIPGPTYSCRSCHCIRAATNAPLLCMRPFCLSGTEQRCVQCCQGLVLCRSTASATTLISSSICLPALCLSTGCSSQYIYDGRLISSMTCLVERISLKCSCRHQQQRAFNKASGLQCQHNVSL